MNINSCNIKTTYPKLLFGISLPFVIVFLWLFLPSIGNSQTRLQWFEEGSSLTNTAEKIQFFTKAIEEKHPKALAYFSRAAAYLDSKEFDKAILDYNSGLTLDASIPVAYNERGYAYCMMGQVDEAEKDYQKAMQVAAQSQQLFVPKYTSCAVKPIPFKPVSVLPPSEKHRIWAVVVGVNRYNNEMKKLGIRDLDYAENDANAIKKWLNSPSSGSVPDETIRVLLSERATKEEVLNACNELFAQATDKDLIFFYFSGHGEDNAFEAYDQKLPHSELLQIFQTSKAKWKVAVADACHSASLSNTEIKSKDIPDYYAFLQNNKGGTFFLLSGAKKSLEAGYFKNGVFTNYFLKGVQGDADSNFDNIITLKEICNYVTEQVKKFAAVQKEVQEPKCIGQDDMTIGVKE